MAREELIIDLPARCGAATEVRSTLICASIQALRIRGYHGAYEAALPKDLRFAITSLVAGQWLPIELAVAHYTTCDQLGVPEAECVAIGADVSKKLQESILSIAVRMSREAGVTPWTVIAHTNRLCERSWRGSGFRVVRVGPKDARIEWHGQPCATSKYFVTAFQGMISTLVAQFAQKTYMRPLPRLMREDRIVYSMAWA